MSKKDNVNRKIENNMHPDDYGDVEVEMYDESIFPSCKNCGNGILKPYVVVFGDIYLFIGLKNGILSLYCT